MTQEDTPNLTQELRLLERKRQALIRVVRLTSSLEKLRQGYEAMLHLGQKDNPLPISAVKLFDQLGRKVRNLSDTDIKLRLGGLDKRVLLSQQQVGNALTELIDPNCTDLQIETVSQQIRDFQRLTHTDIALRVLMGKRRLEVPPLKLAFPLAELKAKISEVTHQERDCRAKVSERIDAIRVDLQRIVYSGLCSAAQKSVLEAMDEALKENIAHINAGNSIEELPTPVEDFELETVANYQVEPAPLKPEPLPQPIVDEQPATGETAGVGEGQSLAANTPPSKVATPQSLKSTPATQSSSLKDAAKPPRSGWIKRFQVWLSTPWDVSWKDTDKENPPASGNHGKQK